MKRLLLLLAVAALVLPAAAFAKGPDEATITGPGLAKAITITGPEEAGSPLMSFAEAAGFFPAAFGQEPNPMLPDRPKGDLGPKYRIDYNVPGGEGGSFSISQDLYPYAATVRRHVHERRADDLRHDDERRLVDRLVAQGSARRPRASEDRRHRGSCKLELGRLLLDRTARRARVRPAARRRGDARDAAPLPRRRHGLTPT